MQSLRYALQPAVTDITEDWSDLSFTHLSPQIKTLFHGQRALIYAQLKGDVSVYQKNVCFLNLTVLCVN